MHGMHSTFWRFTVSNDAAKQNSVSKRSDLNMFLRHEFNYFYACIPPTDADPTPASAPAAAFKNPLRFSVLSLVQDQGSLRCDLQCIGKLAHFFTRQLYNQALVLD